MTVTSGIRCELITWELFYQLARKLSLAMHEASFHPDLVVAISRGGCVPARIICDYLDVFDLDVIKVEHYHGVHKEKLALLKYPLSAEITGKRVLLIDDVSDTGDSFEVGIKHLREHGNPVELKTAALHHKIVSSYTPDFYSEIVREWRWIIYPWAVMEDLGSLLDEMETPPATVKEFSRYISEQHGLEVPDTYLQDILRLRADKRS